MRTALFVLALTIAIPAQAQATLDTLTPRRGLLSGAMGHSPISDARGGMFLTGLALVGAGLVLGGAGFAILYVCREGQSCHSDKGLITAGWVLAAPGVIPLGIGLLLIYISSGGKAKIAEAVRPSRPGLVSVGLVPLPGGGAVTGAFRF
jgi:hypothetical protein